MQKIKSLLTFVLILFAMTAQADSGTTTFVRLDDVTQLKPYQHFIIVSYVEGTTPEYCAMIVGNSNCERYTTPVTMGTDGKIVLSNDVLDKSSVTTSDVASNYKKICLLRATDITVASSTSIKAHVRMADAESREVGLSFLDAEYGLPFSEYVTSDDYADNGLPITRADNVWTISTNAYSDYSDLRSIFSEQLPTYGCIFRSNKTYNDGPRFIRTFEALTQISGPDYDGVDEWAKRRILSADVYPLNMSDKSINGINTEYINGTKTRCYNTRTLIYVKENAVCEHHMSYTSEVQANCQHGGHQASYKCTECGRTFYDMQGTREVTDLADLNTPIGAHQPKLVEGWEPNCWSEGRSDYYECSVCHKYFAEETCQHELSNPDEDCYVKALGHDMKYVEGTNPTCTQPGIKGYYHCDRCSNDFADFEGTQYIERGQYPINPSLGHEYAEGSNTCSRCGHEAETYHQAYNYERVMEDGKCIFVAKIDGKYYTVGNLVNVPSPLEDPRGGRGRGEANTITAYEAIEVTPEADGTIKSSISGLQEFGRELLTPEELQDRFGGWHEDIPAALTLRTNDGYLMEQRGGSNSFGSERDPRQALEVFMPGTWMPEYYYPAQIKAMPLYTTVFQFEHVSVFRFVTVGGHLYFTAEHPSSLYEGYDAYNPELSVCHPEYSYYVYTLKPDTPPTSATPGAPNPYFVLDTDDSGSVDAGDVQNIVNLTIHNILPDDLSKDETIYFDYDGDGNVSIGDVVNTIKLVISGSAGDTPGGTPGISKDPYDGEACSNKR